MTKEDIVYKNILLDLLDQFITICNDYNLKYTLLGGSVLGAIRHGGIIPWDDDIDIGMPRSDFDKLLSLPENVLGNKYKITSMHNDNDYFYPFAKLFNNQTTLIELQDLLYIGGIYIDIFPLDGITKEPIFQKEHILKAYNNRDAAGFLIKGKLSLKYKLRHLPAYLLNKLKYKNHQTALKRCDVLARKYPYDEQYDIVNYFGAWREKEISDYSWFNPLIEHTFEGRKVWIPNNYDAYLTKLYGDYMTPPPIEKRKSHHSHYFIDLTRRYTLEEIREMGY